VAAAARVERASPLPVPETGTHLVVLGAAGGPVPTAGRAGIATALVVDGDVYLVDVGRGALTRYMDAGLHLDRLRAVLVSHLHADHVADLFNVFMLGVDTPAAASRGITEHVPVIGPAGPAELFPPLPDPYGRTSATPGLADLFASCFDAYAYTLNNYRVAGNPDLRELVEVQEVPVEQSLLDACVGFDVPQMEPLRVFENDHLAITAVLVPHLRYSFAFRVDADDGSVVFSGDTGPSANVVALAQGADVLVHEVMDVDALEAGGMPPFVRDIFLEVHTDVTEVGRIAQEAGVETLVLNHFVPADPTVVGGERWRTRAQAGYDGKVVVAEDFQQISVDAGTR
jgi:ribonuclease BN (tRNA processing enzyme)